MTTPERITLKARFALLVALLPILALCAGCGSSSGGSTGSGGSGGSDESAIAEAIEKTVSDPSSACKKYETQNFVEQISHEQGSAAVKDCEESTNEDSESVDVANIEVSGSSATADAAFSGGSFDGQALTIALVKDGEGWKLDEATSFATLDKEALISQIEELLGSSSPDQVSCITDALKEQSNEFFEAFLLKGEASELEKLAEGCA
jgi:hypothetical protein